ncbi:DUF4179 domain-containing protein [Paenibacillus sp. sgz500992]|uniref:DUF4179 domain-containing protein n=1 Tax=Paenibacillus sp. sgz500992 TaxID=3242476 RepID=UPI0036D27D02
MRFYYSREDEGPGNVSAGLQQEATQLLQANKPSIQFEDIWDRHNAGIAGASVGQRAFSPFLKWSIGIGAALIVASGLVIGAGFISPKVAEALRSIPFLEYLYDKGVDTTDLSRIDTHNLTESINVSKEDHGIVFKVVNIYYDGIQLVLNYEVEFPESSPKLTQEQAAVYYELSFAGINPSSIYTQDFTITGEHTFVGTTRLNFGNEDLPEQLKLKMAVDCIGTTRGNWDITLLLDKKKSKEMTQIIYPEGIGFTYGKEEYTVQKLTLGPVTSQVVVKKQNPYYQFNAKLEDDIGTMYGDQGGDGATPDYYYFNFSPLTELNPKPEYVTLKLTEPVHNEDIVQTEERKQLNGVYPLVLHGNHGGKVTITNIQYEEKQTVVTYETSQPDSQDTWLTIENEEGEIKSSRGQPVRISRDSLTFQLTFPPLKKSDKLQVVAHPFRYLDNVQQFELRIPLKWNE